MPVDQTCDSQAAELSFAAPSKLRLIIMIEIIGTQRIRVVPSASAPHRRRAVEPLPGLIFVCHVARYFSSELVGSGHFLEVTFCFAAKATKRAISGADASPSRVLKRCARTAFGAKRCTAEWQ